MKIMSAGFQLPDNGIPMIAEWDEEKGILTFEVERGSEAIEHGFQEELEYAQEWAKRNTSSCHSEEEGNNILRLLGIDERLGVW